MRAGRGKTGRGLGRFAPLVFAACLDPTQATVRIGTDAPCATESPGPGSIVVVGIAAGPPGAIAEQREPNTTTSSCNGGDVGSIVVYPTDGADEAAVLVIGVVAAAGIAPSIEGCTRFASGEDVPPDIAGTCIVARRRVAFIDHTMLDLPVTLYGACAGIRCEADSTCVPGAPPDASGNPCVSSRVTCESDGSCPDPGTGATSSASSTSGAGGDGGAGGRGGGGAGGDGGGGAGYEVLPLPQGATDSAALAVSEDGSTIVGTSPTMPQRPVAWTNGVVEELPFLPGDDAGFAVEACGNGGHAIGVSYINNMGAFKAVRWIREGGNWIVQSIGPGQAIACDESGTLILMSAGGTFIVRDLATMMESDPTTGSAYGMSADGTVVIGSAGNQGVAWQVMPDLTVAPLYAPPGTSQIDAVDPGGSFAVARNASALFRIDLGMPAVLPMTGTAADYPQAVSIESAFRAVGHCTGVETTACVWDDVGVFSLGATDPPPWPLAPTTLPAPLDHVTQASDISRNGHVIVGTALTATRSARAFVLTVP